MVQKTLYPDEDHTLDAQQPALTVPEPLNARIGIEKHWETKNSVVPKDVLERKEKNGTPIVLSSVESIGGKTVMLFEGSETVVALGDDGSVHMIEDPSVSGDGRLSALRNEKWAQKMGLFINHLAAFRKQHPIHSRKITKQLIDETLKPLLKLYGEIFESKAAHEFFKNNTPSNKDRDNFSGLSEFFSFFRLSSWESDKKIAASSLLARRGEIVSRLSQPNPKAADWEAFVNEVLDVLPDSLERFSQNTHFVLGDIDEASHKLRLVAKDPNTCQVVYNVRERATSFVVPVGEVSTGGQIDSSVEIKPVPMFGIHMGHPAPDKVTTEVEDRAGIRLNGSTAYLHVSNCYHGNGRLPEVIKQAGSDYYLSAEADDKVPALWLTRVRHGDRSIKQMPISLGDGVGQVKKLVSVNDAIIVQTETHLIIVDLKNFGDILLKYPLNSKRPYQITQDGRLMIMTDDGKMQCYSFAIDKLSRREPTVAVPLALAPTLAPIQTPANAALAQAFAAALSAVPPATSVTQTDEPDAADAPAAVAAPADDTDTSEDAAEPVDADESAAPEVAHEDPVSAEIPTAAVADAPAPTPSTSPTVDDEPAPDLEPVVDDIRGDLWHAYTVWLDDEDTPNDEIYTQLCELRDSLVEENAQTSPSLTRDMLDETLKDIWDDLQQYLPVLGAEEEPEEPLRDPPPNGGLFSPDDVDGMLSDVEPSTTVDAASSVEPAEETADASAPLPNTVQADEPAAPVTAPSLPAQETEPASSERMWKGVGDVAAAVLAPAQRPAPTNDDILSAEETGELLSLISSRPADVEPTPEELNTYVRSLVAQVESRIKAKEKEGKSLAEIETSVTRAIATLKDVAMNTHPTLAPEQLLVLDKALADYLVRARLSGAGDSEADAAHDDSEPGRADLLVDLDLGNEDPITPVDLHVDLDSGDVLPEDGSVEEIADFELPLPVVEHEFTPEEQAVYDTIQTEMWSFATVGIEANLVSRQALLDDLKTGFFSLIGAAKAQNSALVSAWFSPIFNEVRDYVISHE